jgi:hypothetical protein
MPRIARVVIPGIPHHITQRGNQRQNMFFSDADRIEYLRLVLEYSVQAGLLIIAFCLMMRLSLRIFDFAPEPAVLSVQTRLSRNWKTSLVESFARVLGAGAPKS